MAGRATRKTVNRKVSARRRVPLRSSRLWENKLGEELLKRAIFAVSLLLAAGVGCAEGQDRQSADGTKLFGTRTLKDGTEKTERIELPNGEKYFDVTRLPNGTVKAGRVEYSNGKKHFDETTLPDGTLKIGRIELPNGKKYFDVTILPDGTVKRRAR